jgi:hypothetical protein
MEVTIRSTGSVREPKGEHLKRIMQAGSARARLLKLADRISNLTAVGFVHDVVRPAHAAAVNADMFRELADLIENRRRLLARE